MCIYIYVYVYIYMFINIYIYTRKCIRYINVFPYYVSTEYTIATVCLQKFTCAMALKNDAFHLMIPPNFKGLPFLG